MYVLSVVLYYMVFQEDVLMRLLNWLNLKRDQTVHLVDTYVLNVLVNISKMRLENNDNYNRWSSWQWNHNSC